MYPSQQSYIHTQAPQYSLRSVSNEAIGPAPLTSGGSGSVVPSVLATAVPPLQPGVSSPVKRPLPTPTLPYREPSQTLPSAIASGTESGQVPRFEGVPSSSRQAARNVDLLHQSQAQGSRKPLPHPPSTSPTIGLSWGASTATSADLTGSQDPYNGDGKQPQSATAFTPVWQQYRKLGGRRAKEPFASVSGGAVARRALPVPKQAATAKSGNANPANVPPIFLPSTVSIQGYRAQEISNAQTVEVHRPSSASPPPPPLPPRPYPVQQANLRGSSATPNSPPAKESRKLPSVPQGTIVGAKISAIESLKSMAPFFAEPQFPSEPIAEAEATLTSPSTDEISSHSLDDKGKARVTIPGHTDGVTMEAAPAAFGSVNRGSLRRKSPDPVPESSQGFPNAPSSNVPLEEHRAARSERSRSPVNQESTPESGRPGAGSSAKTAEANIKTRSPPPKFSSFISRTQTTTTGSSWSRQGEPQSMAMRMATLALEEEADAARQRALTTGRHDGSDDDEDDESESSSVVDTDEKLVKIASASQDGTNQRPASDSFIPDIQVNTPAPAAEDTNPANPPSITVSGDNCITIAVPVPQINLPVDGDDVGPEPEQRSTSHPHSRGPSITISPTPSVHARVQMDRTAPRFTSSASGSAGVVSGSAAALYGAGTSLRCAGCREPIVGRIVSAMNQRWHPACFKCVVCGELLEHVSSYEHKGLAYCHLDYHEQFAPYCYHCKTPIADERFITLDDPALGGQRYYHELHFFCAECGDPFLDPSKSSAAPKDPVSHASQDEDDVGFTVYNGHPYCQNCHVQLRMPRCGSSLKPGLRLLPGIGCHKPIIEGTVEAVGRRWHLECFTCSSCKQPFEDPSFFQRGDQAYCDPCYRTIVKSEL